MNDPSKIHVFPPANQCIYCGTTSGRLGKEHIVPFGLGGVHILPRASCDDCSRVTGHFEGICLRNMMGDMRARLRLPTRKPQRRAPTLLFRKRRRSDGEFVEEILPVEEFPLFVTGFLMPPPGILHGAEETLTFAPGTKFWIQPDQVAEQRAGKEYAIPIAFSVMPFGRLIAKIAHSFAAANFGVSSFQPMLLDMIFGRSETDFGHLVGGSLTTPPADNSGLHFMRCYDELTPVGRCLIAEIRLFCCFGTPTYFAVVGKI